MNEYDSNRIYDLTNLIGYKKTEIRKHACDRKQLKYLRISRNSRSTALCDCYIRNNKGGLVYLNYPSRHREKSDLTVN